jgi:PIN domain nuclease of toxin-antitoxin system
VYLLDTHVFFWRVAEPHRLTQTQGRALDEAEASDDPVAISVITLWELAMLAHRGRIQPPKVIDLWLAEIEADPEIAVIPLSGRIVTEAVQLGPGVSNDPADRIIIATARCHGFPLVTGDKRIRDAGVVVAV